MLQHPTGILGPVRLARTFVGDGLVGFDRLGLPAPAADLDLSRFDPYLRWMILHWTGHEDRALTLAAASYIPSDPTWGGWGALSAIALGRLDEAERWIQRSVDDDYRGRVDPTVARQLKALHHTDAWKALRRQTT